MSAQTEKTFHQIHVQILDVTDVYPAWIDGVTHWNGWEYPHFDREVIEQMETESAPDLRVFLDGDTLVVVSQPEGQIPDSITNQMIKGILNGEDTIYFKGMEAHVSYYEPKEIFDGEKMRTVYAMDGLTWNRVEAPGPKI